MNTRYVKQLGLTCAFMTVCGTASADQTSQVGLYFGAGVSQTDLAANQRNMSFAYGTDPGSSFETNGLGLILIAGISVDEHLSLEATYTGLGSIALDDGTTQQKMFDADLFNVSAVLSTPVSEKIELFGKLGLSYWSTMDEDINTLESGTGIVYGAGIDVNLYGNKNRVLRIEWQHQQFEDITFESADTVSAAAVFKF